jgi:hypothetical protein
LATTPHSNGLIGTTLPIVSRKLLISVSVKAGPQLPPPQPLQLSINDEVDCSVFNCCSFIKTKMKKKSLSKMQHENAKK